MRHGHPSGMRRLVVAVLAALAALVLLATAVGAWMTYMPGSSIGEPLPEPTAVERALAASLEDHVRALAADIGERNIYTDGSMAAATAYIEARMRAAGYDPERHGYTLTGMSSEYLAGRDADNLVAAVPGTERPHEVIVVGAHYDTVIASPGADDNASGVAALLALARWFRERPQARTLRFVAFANEEPPFFQTGDMGGHAYAARSRHRDERIAAMLSLDGIGYFTDEPGTQEFPAPGIDLAYPDRGHFIGFVTRMSDATLLRRAVGAFREHATIPSEGAAMPGTLPGVGWSDHWSFWQHDYPAFMVTDTLPFRYPHYHSSADIPERLDYQRMARVVEGLKAVIARLGE